MWEFQLINKTVKKISSRFRKSSNAATLKCPLSFPLFYLFPCLFPFLFLHLQIILALISLRAHSAVFILISYPIDLPTLVYKLSYPKGQKSKRAKDTRCDWHSPLYFMSQEIAYDAPCSRPRSMRLFYPQIRIPLHFVICWDCFFSGDKGEEGEGAGVPAQIRHHYQHSLLWSWGSRRLVIVCNVWLKSWEGCPGKWKHHLSLPTN